MQDSRREEMLERKETLEVFCSQGCTKERKKHQMFTPVALYLSEFLCEKLYF